MGGLTADELDGVRETLEDFLPESGLIFRLDAEADGMGGETEDWGDGTAVAYRLAPLGGGAEPAVADGVQAQGEFVVSVPQATDIREADRFQTAGDEMFEVGGVSDRSQEPIRRAWLTRIR